MAREPDRPPVGVYPHAGLVPYIVAWSAERAPRIAVVGKRHGGIGYAGEKPYDRDADGVLWTRVPSLPGRGRPEFGKVHSLRQRRAMSALLCQVCGGPADRNEDGVLWLLPHDVDDPSAWPGGILTAHPPVCVPCAHTAVHACPRLRTHYVALRVRVFSPAGVRGALYCRAYPSMAVVNATDEPENVAWDDPNIRWVKAAQLLVRLSHYTRVGLTDTSVPCPPSS